jgi:hypothetical protein
MGRVGDCASWFADETNQLRQHCPTPKFDNACPAHTARTAASSKAHDKDGTTNKEFYR